MRDARCDPKRVLMTADTVGGVFQYAVELAGGLASRGIEVAVATMGGPLDRAQREALAGIGPRVSVFESSFQLEWMEEPWEDVRRAGDWLLDIARRLRPDVVHLNGYCHAALPWGCPVVVVAHSCVLSWWCAVHGRPPPPATSAYAERVAMGIQRATAIVAPTHAMNESVHSHYGRRGLVIYNGRSERDFTPLPKQPFVLSLGRVWDEAKNLRVVDAAAQHLTWPVFIGGPSGRGRPAPDFRHARYLGQLGQATLRAFVARASIYALPARYEPFGLSVLEAALSGCALVLGNIPSLFEIWGDAAIYVDPSDVGGLARELERLACRPESVGDLGARARARALRYSARRMVDEYLALYRAIGAGSATSMVREGPACA
jgi:glycosyltransferase involved in cell wall biosynthesis